MKGQRADDDVFNQGWVQENARRGWPNRVHYSLHERCPSHFNEASVRCEILNPACTKPPLHLNEVGARGWAGGKRHLTKV